MDNTVFVTTSDHGDFAGDARLVEKWPAVLMTVDLCSSDNFNAGRSEGKRRRQSCSDF